MVEITLKSYGQKYGNPDCNYKFDVSNIRNPGRDPSFKGAKGTTPEMKKYIMADPIANLTANAIVDFIVKISPFNGMVIALGCTGGRHRSVTITEEVARRLKDRHEINAEVKHLHKHYVREVY